MKATELRIGNIVEYLIQDDLEKRKVWWEINEIDIDDLRYLIEYPNTEDFRPIPISDEWLKKFGFEKDDYGYWSKDGLKGYLTKYVNYGKEGFQYNYNQFSIADCWFVHELQNLFFALTKTELTISNY